MSAIGTALWKRKSQKQGWGDMNPMTRKETKALKQHDTDPNKKSGLDGSYKMKSTFDIFDNAKGAG